MVSLPAHALPRYRSACLGRLSCHPDASMSGNSGAPIPHFDQKQGGVHIGAGFSGHGCYRCALHTFQRQLNVGFVDDMLRIRSNPREPGGLNRWYTFASEHQFRCGSSLTCILFLSRLRVRVLTSYIIQTWPP